jgi:hypothetical protein
MPRTIDEQNKDADHVNPMHSRVRSGNPQLDPEHARRDPPGTAKDQRPHSPPRHGKRDKA